MNVHHPIEGWRLKPEISGIYCCRILTENHTDMKYTWWKSKETTLMWWTFRIYVISLEGQPHNLNMNRHELANTRKKPMNINQILNNNQRRAHAWHKPRRGWQSVTHVKLGFQNPLNMGDMIKNPCGNVDFKIKSSWVKPFGGNSLSWCQIGGVVSGRSFRS